MTSIIKHGFLFVLAGTAGWALIVSAEARAASALPPAGSQSAIPLKVPFIQNQGQVADPRVLFYARTFGGTAYVTAGGEIIYALPKAEEVRGQRSEVTQSAIRNPQSAVLLIRETLVDADLTAAPSGAERSGAAINSFIGNDPRRWQANIPAFAGVQFGDIYEGIALEVRATGDNVEKIFTVAPGADPARIALRLAGAEGVSITPSGELEARTALGPVRFTAPVAYQMGAGGERQGVSVAYALEGDQVGFCVGAFDAARPLVIDPLLASTFIGGSSSNVIRAMALDGQTNVLVAGYTASMDFPATSSYDISWNGGSYDGFIARFDPMLTNLLSATYLGGTNEDAIMAMAINPSNGNVYVAGYTASRNFPTKNALYPTYRGGAYDAFVAVLSSNLTVLTNSTYLGGTNVDMAYALALSAGPTQDVFVAGLTASTNFPITNTSGTASFQASLSGASAANDAFVVRFNAGLSTNRSATYLGGTNDDGAYGLALDTNGFVYVAGYTASTNFPVTAGGVFRTHGGGLSDAFVARLPVALTSLNASTFLGGTSNEAAYGIAVAPFTNIVCVVGYTTSTNYPRNPTNNLVAPGYTNKFMGGKDAFLTRLPLALTNILASTYLGGTNDDEATAVLAYASGANNRSLRIYVAGHTASADFPVTPNAYDTTANGGRDAFVSYFGAGATLQASTYLGGATNDSAYALALSPDRFALFVAGATASANFPATLRAYDNNRAGQTNDDAFVTKLGSGLAYGTLKWQVSLQDLSALAGSPSLGWDGNVYCGAGTNLYAFDAQGRQRWKTPCAGLLVDEAGDLDTTYGMGSTPAVSTNGTIYVTTDAPGSLQAISPAGSSVKLPFSAGNSSEFSSPAIGGDGTIYFGTFGNKFYAVRDSGTNLAGRWTNNLGYPIYSSPAIATNGSIFVANAQVPGVLYWFATNGATNATWNLPGPTYSSPTFGLNGRVYIGSASKLYAFDPGSPFTQRIWTAAGQIYTAPVIGSNGMIYVGGGSNLYEFNPNGTTSRFWATDGAIQSSPTIDSEGSILVGSRNTGLYSFNTNGTTNWVLALDANVFYNSPLIQRDGTIYMTDEENLYAIFGPAPTASTNWPTSRHDVLRTGNAAFDASRFLKPANLVTEGYSNSVLASWQGDPNADYYELWRSPTNDPGAKVLVRTYLLTTNCWDTNAAAGAIYSYWVRVATPVAMSVFSEPRRGGVSPLPPTGVVASKGEQGAPPHHTNEIVITWNASSNATIYYLYHSLTNATNGVALLASTGVTAFTNTGIVRGQTYYYWVKAGNAELGTSGFSAGDGAANSGGTPPLSPASITASTNSYWAVDVAWSASDYAAMYVVYRNGSNGIPGSIIVAITNVRAFGDALTTPFLDYYYWARATNQYGASEFSAAPAAGFRQLAPPRAVSATKGAFPNNINVSWQVEPAATGYLVYRSMTDDPYTASPIQDVPATDYVDDFSIAPGARYFYWVQSKRAGRTSVFSLGDGVANMGGTAPRPPLNLSATEGASDTQVAVTWDVAGYATGYEVYRQVNYIPPSTPLEYVAVPPYADTGALPGLRYYYWVKATNQFGPSELSGVATGYRTLMPPATVAADDGLSIDHLNVTWSISPNASSYELWRGTNSDRAAALMLANTLATNAYDDVDSVQGVLYYYWVRAKTPQFVSAFSPYDTGWRALKPVDIGVSDLVFLPTRMAVGGVPAAVSFRVKNYGVQNMAAPNDRAACSFWISSNSVFGDADDVPMGSNNVSLPLAVNSSVVVVLPKAGRETLAVPAVVPGLYYIFVNIQHAAPTLWLDPNLTNNTASRNGGRIRVGAGLQAGLLPANDYNGDGYTDLAMYQESTGAWQVWFYGPRGVITQGFTMAGYGGPGFKAVPGDYDGDGKTDFAVYQEATGTWKVWFSASDYALASNEGCGGPGFAPVPSDYDGDAKADPAVYQASTGTWKAWFSASAYALARVSGWGGPGFEPVPGDYDGDGKADLAVYREQSGAWRVWRSRWNYAQATTTGAGGSGYRPVVADYDLDGIMDPAVFQASTGTWRIWFSASGYAEGSVQGWGSAGTVAVPGDYDGDGLTDMAIYWDSFGMWRLWLSSTGYQQTDLLAWPGAGFRPVWP